MAQSVTLDMKGEHTYASDIAGVPQGSLALGLNVNINRDGIAEPRRGYDYLEQALPDADDRAKRLFFWNGETFVHYGSTFAIYDALTGFLSRGSLSAPSDATSVRYFRAQNKSLYLTASTGMKAMDAATENLRAAGLPKATMMDLTASVGAGTAVLTATSVTFRYVFGRRNDNQVVMLGGVSGRFTYSNASGSTKDVTARLYLPSGLDTDCFVQLYRTPGASSTATGEEFQQSYEAPITSGDIVTGYIDVTDVTPDALLGPFLYTNPSQQGIVNDKAPPPLARDIAEFKGHAFFADVLQLHRLTFNLISVGSPGIVATDTIVISNGTTTETYTAHATVFNSSIKQFIVTTGGSAAQNIDATIKSFIKCVSLASTLVDAFSLSESSTDLPGRCLIQAKALGSAAFTVTSNRSAAFQPQLPSPAGTNNTSSADQYGHGLMFSAPDQPEAVPLKNLLKVGSSDDRILRIIALRDALLIFKDKDGCWVLTGSNESSFVVKQLDGTARLVAPDTVAVVNNYVYGLFQAGICEVSPDAGVSILSVPVKDQLLPLFGAPLATLKAYAFGFGSDVEGKYILAVPETESDTYCTRQHVYDTFGRTFTKWDIPVTCGDVNPADAKIYLGPATINEIRLERKAFDYTDYADYVTECTVSDFDGTTVTIDNIAGMAVGDVLLQESSGAQAYIESIDAVAGTIVIDTEQEWDLGSSDVLHYAAIDCKIQWNPDFGGNAAMLKQYYECELIQKQAFQKSATLTFSTDINPSEQSIPVTSASGNGAWGQFDFGDEVFGGEQAKAPKRLGVPRGHSRCNQLSVRFENRVAFSDFQLTGLSLTFNATSTRTTR